MTEEESIEGKLHALSFSVQLSARYHARRQAFYGRWRRFTAACSAVLGAVAGGNALANGDHSITAKLSLGVAALGAIDLVVGTAKMENLHRSLRQKFLALQSAIDGAASPTTKDLGRWQKKRLKIEENEPPVFHILAYQTRNELCRAIGAPARLRFSLFQRVTSQFMHWTNAVPRTRPNTVEILWARLKRGVRRQLLGFRRVA
jgi:hypothetical protein